MDYSCYTREQLNKLLEQEAQRQSKPINNMSKWFSEKLDEVILQELRKNHNFVVIGNTKAGDMLEEENN